MTARILVIDDIEPNARFLEARLTAEYFDVSIALNGRDGLAIALAERIDLVLLDVMMPDMSGFDVCSALKADPRTAHIPVIMVTALDHPHDRVRGLESGADDFLTKPVSETALVTRVKSLVRLKMMTDELSVRAIAMQSVGFDSSAIFAEASGIGGRILVLEDRENSIRQVRQATREPSWTVEITSDVDAATKLAMEAEFDLLILSLTLKSGDGLRLCTKMRNLDGLRHAPILLITDETETPRLMRALDVGVNDYVIRPIDPNELRARVRTQLRRRQYAARLRDTVATAVELAITDPLTKLYNRRYLDTHLKAVVGRAASTSKPACVLIFDIDHFKSVNDNFGHDVGDAVLRDFSDRLRRGVRGIDLVARYGGEEFVVVMPETDAGFAAMIAERLRLEVEMTPFTVSGNTLPVTVSIGIAEWTGPDDTPKAIMRRADLALYSAKHAGRNRVVASAA